MMENVGRVMMCAYGRGYKNGRVFRPNGEKEEGMTYKSRLAAVDERFGREPFPHERARGSIVDRVDQATNVVVD
jgi:hypothetical protein